MNVNLNELVIDMVDLCIQVASVIQEVQLDFIQPGLSEVNFSGIRNISKGILNNLDSISEDGFGIAIDQLAISIKGSLDVVSNQSYVDPYLIVVKNEISVLNYSFSGKVARCLIGINRVF